MHLSTLLAAGSLALGVSAAGKNYLGFNSGNTKADRSPKFKADFEAEFKAAAGLQGTPGTFNSVRLYTNIQAGSQSSDPIEAFDAAIDTKTYMLLGVWASGVDNIDNEISALNNALNKYGSKFTDLVIGISIGSEDLYRDSATGTKNKAGVGNSPDNIIKFINDFKKAFANSPLGKVPVGHVDTWDVWTNSTIKPVIEALDWVGVDEYPFYETGKGNSIKNAPALFDRAYEATIGAVNGKPVWVTETGWPISGKTWDQAVPSTENAKYYWDEVGCRKLFNKTPTFWYTLRDSNPDNDVKFGISQELTTTPAYNLTCPTHFDTDDSTTASGTSKPTGSATGSATGTNVAPSASSTGGSSGSGSRTGSGSSDAGSSSGSGSGSGSGSSGNAASGTSSGAAASHTSMGTMGKVSGTTLLALVGIAAAALL